jgi:molybdopterin-guanine dinucleotide biosynthesis protein A
VADEIFVVASDASRFTDLGLTVHPDRVADLGAIGGIDTALTMAAGDRVIIVACDLPFLSESLLAELVRRASTGDGAWVRGAHGIEPLLACYRRHASPAVRAAIAAGQLAARGLATRLRMLEIGPDELARYGAESLLLSNVNTPEDYRRVQYGG